MLVRAVLGGPAVIAAEDASNLSRYRAQVLGVNGWVDGGLFTREKEAMKDAERLADLFGLPTRVVPHA